MHMGGLCSTFVTENMKHQCRFKIHLCARTSTFTKLLKTTTTTTTKNVMDGFYGELCYTADWKRPAN